MKHHCILGPALRDPEITALSEHRAALEAIVDAHDELIASLPPASKAVVCGVMLNRVILAKRVLGRIP